MKNAHEKPATSATATATSATGTYNSITDFIKQSLLANPDLRLADLQAHIAKYNSEISPLTVKTQFYKQKQVLHLSTPKSHTVSLPPL